jgi:hypothetical protein
MLPGMRTDERPPAVGKPTSPVEREPAPPAEDKPTSRVGGEPALPADDDATLGAGSEPASPAGDDVTPGAGGEPTKVTIAMQLLDLDEIDDIKQRLTGDFEVFVNWTDPRLSKLAGCQLPLSEIWSPSITFLNSGQLRAERPEQVAVGDGGQVQYLQRYQGSLSTYHNLQRFPFDDHVFRISLLSSEYGEKDVLLVANDKLTGVWDRLNISDWKIGGVTPAISRLYSKFDDVTYSLYDFEIKADRITAFYVWKVIVPLCLIVFMSWTVFWINPAQFGPQIQISATSMLTIIAFQFATAQMLPELGYFTVLDLFIGGAMILVFLALLEALITSYLVSKELKGMAERVDLLCRVAFPLTFVALIGVVFFL